MVCCRPSSNGVKRYPNWPIALLLLKVLLQKIDFTPFKVAKGSLRVIINCTHCINANSLAIYLVVFINVAFEPDKEWTVLKKST